MQVLFARHRTNIYRGQRDRRSQRPGEAPAVSAISVGLGVWSRSVGESAKLIPHSGRDYGPGTSRLRHDHARRPNSDTAIEVGNSFNYRSVENEAVEPLQFDR